MTRLSVPEMTCGHCKAAVEQALTAADPGARVAVDLAARQVEVAGDLSSAAMIAALAAVGFEATVSA